MEKAYVELDSRREWIAFSKGACELMGIKDGSPILVFSVKGQDMAFCFQIRRMDEVDKVAVGFASKPTAFSKQKVMRWIYDPHPSYMMHKLLCYKNKNKFELKMKETDFGTLFYIGVWMD